MVKMYKCGIGIKIIYFRNTYNFFFFFFCYLKFYLIYYLNFLINIYKKL